MNSEIREQLRREVDAAVRQRVRQASRPGRGGARYCVGCGGPAELWTLDCNTCRERHYRRHREGTHKDPAYYARRLEEVKAYAEGQRGRGLRFDGTPAKKGGGGGGRGKRPSIYGAVKTYHG